MTIFELIEKADANGIMASLKGDPKVAFAREDITGFTPLIKLAKKVDFPEKFDRLKFFEVAVDALLKNNDLEVIAATDFITGRTALHWACETDNIPFYRALYKHTGNHTWWYHRDFGGKTPVALARENEFTELMIEMELGRCRRVGRGPNRLAIIGMGPAGSALFIRLIKRLEWTGAERFGAEFIKSIRFDLYDKGELGLGTPYDPQRTTNTSLLNVAAGGMSIDADSPLDFVAWIKELELKGTLHQRLGAAAELGLCPASARVDGYYPRTFYGEYLVERVKSFIRRAAKLGVEVVEHAFTEVTKVSEEEKGGYKIISTTKGEQQAEIANFVYYTTGHFTQKDSPADSKNKSSKAYIDTPINANGLNDRGVFSKDVRSVGVLGSSLSAVDVIFSLLLHPSVGELKWRGQTPVYLPKRKEFKVTCYSRKGLFSKVRPSSNRDLDLTHLSPHAVALAGRSPLGNEPGKLSVAEMIESLEKELAERLPELKVGPGQHKGLIERLSDPFKHWEEMGHDPFKYLEGDIQWADDGQDTAGNVRWYQVMHSLFPVVRTLYRQFTTEQRAEFSKNYGSLWLWAFAPMPMRSAKVLLAMHKAGALDLFRVNGSPDTSGKKVKVPYKDNSAAGTSKTAEHDFLCSTIGLHSIFHLDSSDLTKNSKSKDDAWEADADFVFFDPYSVSTAALGGEQKKPAQERTAWIADDGTFELAMVRDKKLVHTPARRGVGYFLQDQMIDVQAVPSVVKYSAQVAELYYDEFVHMAGKSVVTGKDLPPNSPKK
ncbi:MAG: FAD/NAD(P)-binding protein [Gammaproteobacteria bacterium]|nr:FAD/NAD(P)-binding protein [Gammaproteobacteria bacterium]MBU2408693.1 FAD/NAD(P)-binding protein [Gammaproteobacteria bacterium]